MLTHSHKILFTLITLFATFASVPAQKLVYKSSSRLEPLEGYTLATSAKYGSGTRCEATLEQDWLLPEFYSFTAKSNCDTIKFEVLMEPLFLDRRTIRFYIDGENGGEVVFTPDRVLISNAENNTCTQLLSLDADAFNTLSKAIQANGAILPDPSPELYQVPAHLDLVVSNRAGDVLFTDLDTWRACPDKDSYTKIGIYIIGSGERFMVNWEDCYDKTGGYTDWYTAVELYGEYLPTRAQGKALQNCANLREMAAAYGSDNYGNWYWTRTECEAPDSDNAYIFCPGIPDAYYDSAPKAEPSNNGILLIAPL